MKQKINFSGLNGLRAIAALAVLFSHTTMGLASFGLNSFIFGKLPDGNPKTTFLAGFGVSIFFSLSGFLITYLLLEEKKDTKVNIKNFYMRRILRIWPLYYLYFFLCILTAIIFDLQFDKSSILFYIFLSANVPFIFGGEIVFLGHYWSLGVEEQFYSFWPWIVQKSKSIFRITIILCSLLITLKTLSRFIAIKYGMDLPYLIIHVTRFHCMLIGGLGAILYFEKNTLFLKVTNNLISQSISWFIIMLVAINKFHIMSFLDNEIISLITVFIIIGQIEKTNRIFNLDTFLLGFIGKISFGVYVIHPLIIFYLAKIITFSTDLYTVNYVIVYSAVFATTIILAYLSYEFFEKRFLHLKEKYSTVISSSTKPLSQFSSSQYLLKER